MITAFQDATWQAIGWTAIVFLVGFIFGRRTGGGRDLAGPPRMQASAPVRPASPRQAAPDAELDPVTRTEIEAMLAAGHKIEAIKLMREATGLSLKEAKEAVEGRRF